MIKSIGLALMLAAAATTFVMAQDATEPPPNNACQDRIAHTMTEINDLSPQLAARSDGIKQQWRIDLRRASSIGEDGDIAQCMKIVEGVRSNANLVN